MKKHKILVSACLLGESCRYDGRSKPCERVLALADKFDLVPVCPERLGGLPTPRTPSERLGNRVFMRDGRDVTENYRLGAIRACNIYKEEGCVAAVLKARSPSCAVGEIYDGTFSRTLISGNGITADALAQMTAPLYTECEVDELLKKTLDK